jgi:hypothetical protein
VHHSGVDVLGDEATGTVSVALLDLQDQTREDWSVKREKCLGVETGAVLF